MPEQQEIWFTLPCTEEKAETMQISFHPASKLLELINDEHIFKIELQEDKQKVCITEMCDQCFEIHLSKEYFGSLIKELIDIYNKMES